MTPPARIQRLIDAREMEAVDPDPEKVIGLWEKALASNADSRKGLSADNAIALAYQSGFQACTALLEAHGYRTRGSTPGHHRNTFYATSALGHPALEDVDVESESVRMQRTKSFYSGTPHGEQQVERMHAWLDRLLPAVHEAVSAAAPALRAELRLR
jgi:hypothetical protein